MQAYKHQKEIIDKDKKKNGIFLGTGAGKSFIALSLAVGKTLVIVPKTIREDGTWERQLSKMDKKLDLTVISKETFRRDWNKLSRYDTVICDEAHCMFGVMPNVRYKNRKPIPKTSQLFEALDFFLQKTKPDRFYPCTATIIKSAMTVWGAQKLLGYDADFYKWRDRFYVRLPIPGKDIFAPKTDSDTKNYLAKCVKSIGDVGRLEDYVDMPEQTFKTVYVELTPKQKQRIKEIPMEYPDPMIGALKKHMIENGCLIGDEFNLDEEFENEKIEKLVEMSLEFPRMMVFARYKLQIAQIARRLMKEGRKVLILTGDTKDRGEVIREANTSSEYVFICQSQISAGFEVPECPVMVFASLDFSLVNLVQSQGRISRINNPKRNLYIYLTVKGGVDDHVYKTVVGTKMDFHLAQFNK